MLNTSQLRNAWYPPCHGPWATMSLHGGGRVQVRASIIEATKALNQCLKVYDYRTKASQTGAFNCLAGETKVVTKQGLKPIASLSGTKAEILTRRSSSGNGKGGPGAWRHAEIKSYGVQSLRRITLSSCGLEHVIHATPEHRWFTGGGSSSEKDKVIYEVTTDELTVGDKLVSLRPQSIASRTTPSPIGIMAGLVFGDGSLDNHNAHINLCGNKNINFLKYFPSEQVRYDYTEKSEETDRGGSVIVGGLPRSWKTSGPDLEEGPCYLYGWLAGYFAADGRVTKEGSPGLNSYDRENLELVKDVALACGITTRPITETQKVVTPPGSNKEYNVTQYSLVFHRKYLDESFFLDPEHRRRFNVHATTKPSAWKVVSVEPTDRIEEVYCAEVEDTECFVLENDILTGNCRVITGGRGYSLHAYGIAIDINWLKNLYSRRRVTDMPSGLPASICRIRTNNGRQVWSWGGYWSGTKDCVTGDTLVVTRDGSVPIRELSGKTVEVLSTTDDPTVSGWTLPQWVKAPVNSYGLDKTYTVKFRRGDASHRVRCNSQHRWPIQMDGSIGLVSTTDLLKGLKIPALDPEHASWEVESVTYDGVQEEVFCATVEGRGVFALATESVPILTGNSMHYEVVCSPRDLATGINWRTVPGSTAPPPPPPKKKLTKQDWAALRRIRAAQLIGPTQRIPNMGPGNTGPGPYGSDMQVAAMQIALNFVTGTTLPENGIYDVWTAGVVTNFQNFVKKVLKGPMPDPSGHFRNYTRFYLVAALENIRDGKA